MAQQIGHGACGEVHPGLQPAVVAAGQRGRAQLPPDLRVGAGDWCARSGQSAGAVQPEGVDGQLAAFGTPVVEGMGVEQHLHLAVQALQRAVLSGIGLPVAHIAQQHAVQCGRLQRLQCRPVHQPAVRALVVQVKAVFGKPGRQQGQQGAGVGLVQLQIGGVVHADLVGARSPVAGAHEGPGATGCAALGAVGPAGGGQCGPGQADVARGCQVGPATPQCGHALVGGAEVVLIARQGVGGGQPGQHRVQLGQFQRLALVLPVHAGHGCIGDQHLAVAGGGSGDAGVGKRKRGNGHGRYCRPRAAGAPHRHRHPPASGRPCRSCWSGSLSLPKRFPPEHAGATIRLQRGFFCRTCVCRAGLGRRPASKGLVPGFVQGQHRPLRALAVSGAAAAQGRWQ